jgi:glucose/mannose transport system substrate-binding protein
MLDARQGNRARRVVVPAAICWAGLLSGAIACLGCSDNPRTVTLEVYSWWQEDSERQAFEEVIQIHRESHPNVIVKNLGDAAAPEIRESLAARMMAGAPPATFQTNIGSDALRWTMIETQDPVDGGGAPVERRRFIRPVSGSFDRSGLGEHLRNGLRSNLEVAGSGPWGVPINIHRENVVYYNRAVLAAFMRGDSNRSFPDLATLCPDPITDETEKLNLDIVIGVRNGWPLVLLTFENVLPALYGPDFYEYVFQGHALGAEDRDKVRRALQCVQYLSRSFRVDSRMGWAEAVRAVRDGAAFTVMGDWSIGLITNDLVEHDGEPPTVMSIPFPGTEEMFVYTSDTFPLPIGTANEADAEALLDTIGSRDAQRAFSAKKGSIPARDDVNIDSLTPPRAETVGAFENSRLLVATSGLFPSYYPQGELADRIVAMLGPDKTNAEVDAALQFFVDAQPILARFREELAKGPADPIEP